MVTGLPELVEGFFEFNLCESYHFPQRLDMCTCRYMCLWACVDAYPGMNMCASL